MAPPEPSEDIWGPYASPETPVPLISTPLAAHCGVPPESTFCAYISNFEPERKSSQVMMAPPEPSEDIWGLTALPVTPVPLICTPSAVHLTPARHIENDIKKRTITPAVSIPIVARFLITTNLSIPWSDCTGEITYTTS